MIFDFLFELLAGLVGGFFSIIPSVTLPDFLGVGGAMVGEAATLGATASGFAPWVPFSAVADVISAVLLVIPICVGVGIARMVISMLSGGGGSA